MRGTSVAAAGATGVAALAIEANRQEQGAGKPLSPSAIKVIL